MTAQVFMDTESVGHPDEPWLLSIGLVAGFRELYMELPQDDYELVPTRMQTLFIRQFVEPQFGRMPDSIIPERLMGARLAGWLTALGSTVVEVVFDSSAHYRMLSRLLRRQSASGLPLLYPGDVGCILELEEGGLAAVEALWAIEETRGLRRHHALADAYSLQARYRAVSRSWQ